MTTTAQRTANVFLFEQPRQDVTDVEHFGTVHILFRPAVGRNTRSSIWDTDSVAHEIIEALEVAGFDPAIDMICISGSLASLAIFVATVIAEYGRVKSLLFDAKERCYVLRELGEPIE